MAGSEWSGSSPAVCESANHGRIGTGGRHPQARVGRHGAHGPSASGLAGMEWSVLIGHGFSRQESQGLAFLPMEGTAGMVRRVAYRPGAIWQAALRWARIPRFPMAWQARHLTQMQGGYRTAGSAASGLASNGLAWQEWHSTAGPVIAGFAGIARPFPARQAAQCSSRPGNTWHGRQRSAVQGHLVTAGTPRHGTIGTEGRQGVASLEGKQRQARPRWSANAWKERQALCRCHSAA
jgi:hypothetical protein